MAAFGKKRLWKTSSIFEEVDATLTAQVKRFSEEAVRSRGEFIVIRAVADSEAIWKP